MGKKYIIEFEDKPFGNGLYKAKGFNSLVFDQNGLDRLTPFEEEIKVGDIIVHGCDNIKAAVIDSTENKYIVFDENGCVYSIKKEEVKPTGEYTDLVEALMLKVQHTHIENMA